MNDIMSELSNYPISDLNAILVVSNFILFGLLVGFDTFGRAK